MEEQKKGDSFLITPMNQHFYLKPGQVFEGSIKVVNPANSIGNFNYVVSVAPYGVVGEDYDVDLTTNSYWNQIAEWITIENDKGVLTPNEVAEVKFTITVPENAPAGAQSATIVVTQDKDNEAQSGMMMENIFEMASIIYADIEGEMRHEASILSNGIPSFSDVPTVTLGVLLDNNGNVFEEVKTGIKVRNVISGETILPTEVNEGMYVDIVMPETRRYIQRNVVDLPFLGVVNIEQTVYYNGVTSVESRDVFICPIWFMVLVGITIALFVAAIVKLIKLHERKKMYV